MISFKRLFRFGILIQAQYLIKYKGYPDSENTWEPIENLNCPRMVRKFEKDLQKNESYIPVFHEFECIRARRNVAEIGVSCDLCLLISRCVCIVVVTFICLCGKSRNNT